MFELFKAEFNRYKKYAMGIFVILMGFLIFLNRIMPLLEFDTEYQFIQVCLFGALFGIVQFALLKRKNSWTYLIHRPMSEFKIHTALVAAGVLIVFIAAVLPFLIMVISIDIVSSVGDYRHYVYCLNILMLAMVSYFIGSYVVLSPNWGALLMFPMVLYMHVSVPNSIGLSLTTDMVILVAVYYLSARSFKANANKHLTKKSEMIVAVLMMNLSLSVLVFLSQVLIYHMPLYIMGTHPDINVVKDSYQSLWDMSEKEQIRYIIDQSNLEKYSETEQLLARVKEKSGDSISASVEITPFRGQLYNKDLQNYLIDAHLGIKWTFSHDEMLLIGQHMKNGRMMGYLGKTGFVDRISEQDRFDVVPTFKSNRFIKTDDEIYFVKFDEVKLGLIFQLPEGEKFMTKLEYKLKDLFVAVSSNKSLYLFDSVNFTNEQILAVPSHIINHPNSLGRKYFLNYINLTDGRLFNYRSESYFGINKAGANLIVANNDGSVDYIAEMQFAKNRYPDWVEYMFYWISPIVNGSLFSIIDGLYEPHDIRYVQIDNFWEIKLPRNVVSLGIIFLIFSSVITYWMAGKIEISKSGRYFWTIMALIFGLPGLVSFFLLNHWLEYIRRGRVLNH